MSAKTYQKPILFKPDHIQVHSRANLDGSHDVNTSMLIAGRMIRLVRYHDLQKRGGFNKTKRKDYSKGSRTTRLEKNIRRAQNMVQWLIMQNHRYEPVKWYQKPVWGTLTYPNVPYAKIHNRKEHIKDVQRFMRLIRRKYKSAVKMIAVMELQQNGSVHWHMILFDLPKYETPMEVAQIWVDLISQTRGIVPANPAQHFKRIPWGYKGGKNASHDIAEYIGKYMGEEIANQDLSHTKLYLCSKNLDQPVRLLHPRDIRAKLEQAVADAYWITYQSAVFTLPHVGDLAVQILEPDP